MESQQVPDGWGSDSLTAFFDWARSNSYASYSNLGIDSRRLVELDGLFGEAVSRCEQNPDVLPASLLIRCHSAYRAACQLVMSGQLPEFYAVSRSALEYALYCSHLARHPELQEVWFRRHDDDTAMRKVRGVFKPSTLISEVEQSNVTLGKVAKALYDGCIDFGAHPNERALTSNSEIRQLPTGVEIRVNYLAEDGQALRSALRVCAQTAICSLEIVCIAGPAALEDSDLFLRAEAVRRAM